MARLRYTPDDTPGITRQRCGRGFTYLDPAGTRITCPTERARLRALAVPPAYTDVWLNPRDNGHLQASGRDDKGRKQYIYHPDWAAQNARRKFDRLIAVGEGLPTLRRWITSNLQGPIGAQDTAVAAVLALIDRAAMRPGHADYTAQNGTHGATTLHARHLTVEDGKITLSYVAKGGAKVRDVLTGQRLAKVLQDCADLPGPELMVYLSADDTPIQVRTEHLSDVLTALCGPDVTPKALRTWAGTHAAFLSVLDADPDTEVTITHMAQQVAARLHNTPAIARESYIHPKVVALRGGVPRRTRSAWQRLETARPPLLRRGEGALLRYLQT